MRWIMAAASAMLATAALVVPAGAQMPTVSSPSDLKPFNVTVRRFDTGKGLSSDVDFVLPVDSPDAEHACASTIANAAAFSRKVEGGKPLPLAFTCTKIEKR